MKKQTAVEYLIQSINERIDLRTLKYWNEINEFVEKAKAMEKEQIQDAYYHGIWLDESKVHSPYIAAEDYYTSTYES
jgi:hypothetical protein